MICWWRRSAWLKLGDVFTSWRLFLRLHNFPRRSARQSFVLLAKKGIKLVSSLWLWRWTPISLIYLHFMKVWGVSHTSVLPRNAPYNTRLVQKKRMRGAKKSQRTFSTTWTFLISPRPQPHSWQLDIPPPDLKGEYMFWTYQSWRQGCCLLIRLTDKNPQWNLVLAPYSEESQLCCIAWLCSALEVNSHWGPTRILVGPL